jgi:hypothetical protein
MSDQETTKQQHPAIPFLKYCFSPLLWLDFVFRAAVVVVGYFAGHGANLW